MLEKTIRIGTRDSELALWQAHTVQKKLNDLGYATQIIAVKSTGDLILDKPLYELGITGIFTKTLDIAMLKEEVDIAVHSMKDVPTILPNGIVQGAVLERASTLDILVHKGNLDFLKTNGIIASGSLRRKAQWLDKYPSHKVEDLRGNVNTRMQKLHDNNWNGAIFAAAGLDRINLKPSDYIDLDWMTPAPAQGAMLVVAMEKDNFILEALKNLNHKETEICTYIERQFLRTLEGGCTAPIGALAIKKRNQIDFKGVLFSLDGKEKFTIEKSCNFDAYINFGQYCANEILKNGGKSLMEKLRIALKVK
jgi:hydroxymethylbilane synthase